MTPKQAYEFQQAITNAGAFVPPIFFDRVVNHDVMGMIAAVARGEAVCEFKPVTAPAAADAAPAVQEQK